MEESKASLEVDSATIPPPNEGVVDIQDGSASYSEDSLTTPNQNIINTSSLPAYCVQPRELAPKKFSTCPPSLATDLKKKSSTSQSGEESISEHIPSYEETQSASLNIGHDASGRSYEIREDSEHAKSPEQCLHSTEKKSDNKKSPEGSKQDSSISEYDPSRPESKQNSSKADVSWPKTIDKLDVVHISNESSILTLFESSAQSQSRKFDNIVHKHTVSEPDEYPDSLTYGPSHTVVIESPSKKDTSSSSSEEIIKLDIRGQAAPKFYTLPAERFIIGPQPKIDSSSYITIAENETTEPKITNLMSQFALGPISESNNEKQNLPVDNIERSSDDIQEELFYDSINAGQTKNEEADCLIEELVVENTVENESLQKDLDMEHVSFHTQSKSFLDQETPSLSTMTTDYKTICEEYHGKLVQFEAAMSKKEDLIKDLTISLQQSLTIREELQFDNKHLTSELGKLQMLLTESLAPDNGNVQGQLSDYMKYEGLVKGEDTRYFSAFMSREKSFDRSSQRGSSNSEKDIDVEEMTIDFSKSSPKSTDDIPTLPEMEAKLSSLVNELHEYITKDGVGTLSSLKDKIITLCQAEIEKIRQVAETEYKVLQKQHTADKQAHNTEAGKMRALLSSVKTGNANLSEMRDELNVSHEKEMENLRTYYEKICSDMKKNYSEEVFSQHSLQQLSPGSSADSLDRCPAALPFGSPLHSGGGDRLHRRSKSVDFQAQAVEIAQLEVKIKQLNQQYQQQMDALKAEHVAYVNDLVSRHKEAIIEMDEAFKDQIAELKAHIQTAENTEETAIDPNATINIYDEDIDLELEKGVQANMFEEKLHEAKQDVILHMQEQIQALLSDPNADLNSWPLDLVALRDKLHTDAQQTIHHMKIMHEEELSSLRAEHARQLTSVAEEGPTCGLHAAEHWRRRRNDSFDENRRLEEITKQRDGFKERTGTLQRLVQLLVNYLEQCEDEVNNTILEELLKLPVAAGVNLDITNVGSEELDSRNPSLNTSLMSVNVNAEADPNMSVISTSKRVHFAPDVQGFLSQLNDESMINCLEQEKNLSVEIKHELDVSLQRLRQEAQELLALSVKVSANRAPTSHADEKGAEELHQCNGDEMRRLVEEMETTKRDCDVCEMEKKQLEETISESLHRELLLREQLEQAMVRIDNLMTDEEHNNSREIITEGYGTALPPRTPVSLPPPSRMPVVSPPAIIVESRSVSLDGSTTSAIRRAIDVTRLAAELETVVRARDDLEMQLEAANRQLKSTRQFVEEQTSEREHERDEYACELKQLRDENSKLLNKLQHNGRIRSEVDQLEAHMREMTLALTELEAKKSESEAAVVASGEKISVLQDVIADLEGQLEFKATSETDILAELGEMRKTIDLRDSKMRELLQELESLKSEQAERTEMENVSGKDNSLIEAESSNKMMDQMREQLSSLEESIHKRTITLERIHEAVCSHSCSSPSEDVSIRDQKIKSASLGSSARDICVNDIPKMPILSSPTRTTPMAELSRLAEYLQHHFRAEDAALKRIRDLEMQLVQVKDVAQELRTERDVLQERMSEQTLKISSLQMRLDEQRHCAEALRQESNSQLAARLHDALAELQNARETLESKEKQISRLKALVEETKKRLGEREMNEIYVGNNAAGDPVAGLERDLQEAQSKNRELYQLAESIDITKTADIKQLKALLDEKERQLDDKEEQLQGLLALKLDDENAKDNSKTEKEADGGKISARTLSDIVSISEYDEQDLQMRRAELRPLTANISGTPLSHHDHNKELNKTLPPEFTEKPQMRSLHLDHSSFNVEHLDLAEPSPRPFSAPLTGSPLVRGKSKVGKYKRNVNETLMFGTSIERLGLSGDDIKHSTAHGIPDNCSMYPNKDVDESKDNTVEPKKINFSIKSDDSAKKLEHKSLKDLGITIDSKQEQYPDILTQLKQEIFTLRAELEEKTSVLKEAEDQLSEFPTVNREMEELKNMLQSSITTMKQEKQFYETQLEDFSANKQLLEEQLASALNQANEKTKDLKLLKEDILRRENMVLELAKEKRALQNQLTEFEVKCQSLLDRNAALEACENENIQMREKLVELKKLEQLISEKNLQIDSLNEHLDRLDDLQRCLDDKTEEVEKLTDVIDEKAAEILQLQENERVTAAEIGKITENNRQLKVHNEEIVERLTKFEKEQENLKQKANMLSEKEKQLEKISTINSELTGKLEEMKSLTNKLNDKECEIEILNEDINSFHDEIASLKEQLKLASRSPSPRDAKVVDERMKMPGDKQTVNDKKQLGKIRKQVSLLQSELNYNKKDLNERVFELERTKLEVIELRNELGHARKRAAEQEGVLTQALKEAEMLRARLQQVLSRLKEEANLEEIQEKLRAKTEDCAALERELELLRDALDRLRASTPTHGPLAILGPGDEVALIRSGQHSPTEELEERVRRELQYARQLDDTIMDQIFSGGSTSSRSERNLVEMVDDEEEVPPLELHTSRSNSSLRSSASERLVALQRENDQLRAQLLALETRLAEREALVGELAEDARAARLRLDAERDNSGRLQLLLETHRQSADDVQTQDVNVIQILRSRLEGAMETESDLQQALEKERLKVHQLQLQLSTLKRTSPTSPNNQQDQGNQLLKMQLENQVDANERLKSEIMLLKAKLDREKSKLNDTRSQLDKEKRWYQRELEARTDQCNTLRSELAELKRLKHEAGVELVHAREAVHVQKKEIANLEKRIAGLTDGSRGDAKPFQSILIEFEQQKGDLSKEITSLKKALELANQREMNLHQFLISSESSSKMTEALGVLKEEKAILKEEKVALKEEKAILQERIRLLEQELANLKGQKASETSKNQVEEYERGVRYLHACLLRVESYRKALIWQKRYLMRVLSGYVEVEQTYAPPTRSRTCKGKQRFRCIAFMVITVLRLGFLVRRRHNTKVFSANCLFGREDSEARKTPGIQISNSPPMRDKSHRSVFTPSSLLRQSSTTPTTAYKEWQRAPRTTPFRSKDLATEEKSREASYPWRSKNLEERSKEVMESQSPTPSAGSSCRNAELRRRTVGRSSRSSTSTFGDEGSHVRSSTTEQESKAVLTQLSRRLDHYSLKVSQTLDTHHHAP